MSQRSLGQARFSDQWQKQILPNTMTKIKERWLDHGYLNKGWFSCPSARVRYVLAASFVKERYLFVQILCSNCANSNFSPKTVTFDFHELIEFIGERFESGCAKSVNPSPEYHLQIVTGFGKFWFQHFPTGSEICPIFGRVP